MPSYTINPKMMVGTNMSTLNQPAKDNDGLVPMIAAGPDTGLWAFEPDKPTAVRTEPLASRVEIESCARCHATTAGQWRAWRAGRQPGVAPQTSGLVGGGLLLLGLVLFDHSKPLPQYVTSPTAGMGFVLIFLAAP